MYLLLSKMYSHYSIAFIINLKEKKNIRKCDSKVLKTFSYFFFVDALNTKQIISTLFRVRRNRHWFCLVSLVSLKIKPFNQCTLWNYLIFENVVSDHKIQIKLNIVRNYLYYSVHDFFWLLSHGHVFHISVFNLFSSPDPKGHASYCHHWASVVCRPSVRPLTFHILINSSEAIGPIWTKLWWNGPWMALFQKCVRWSWLSTKMATKLKIEKGGWNFNCPLLL
jgi:hypothetical protein